MLHRLPATDEINVQALMDGTNLNCIKMKAIILHWGRGSSSTNNSKLSKSPANSKCTSSPPSLFPCNYWLYPSRLFNLAGGHFFYIRTIFIFQAECVLTYMVLFFYQISAWVFLIHLFFYAGFQCRPLPSSPGLCIKTRLSAQPSFWYGNDFSFSCK